MCLQKPVLMLKGIAVTQTKRPWQTILSVIHLICTQQLGTSHSVTEERLHRKIVSSWTCGARSWKFEKLKCRKIKKRWNEDFIALWKKLKCQSTWRTQSDAGVAIDTTLSVEGPHAISPAGLSPLSLSSLSQQLYCHLKSPSSLTLKTQSCFPSWKKIIFLLMGLVHRHNFNILFYRIFVL